MRQIDKIVLSIFVAIFLFSSAEAKKRALTIFVGDYPTTTSGWSQIHSSNDKTIILETLKRIGFQKDNIVCLEDSKATYAAITKAFKELIQTCQTGDEVYVHFSGHGQLITDMDGDEILRKNRDRYDESFIPYDAYIAYNWNGYMGERHLVDDELSDYLREIERKIGKKGYLMVVVDACHSGDIQRIYTEEEEPQFERGSGDRFDIPPAARTCQTLPPEPDCIIITACQSFESNHECKVNGLWYGRLSYAVSKAWKPGMTQKSLQDALSEQFRFLAKTSPLPLGRTQNPVFVESRRYSNRKLF